ncbi:MAG: ribosomal-protein-alanine acetyltransferase [Halobacteriovoraceae bacterium]|nr:ribosomal-protein-alanine acetyltransferase [Halobacteriovoraceae bacterium]|tara:strand:+ start:55745 stop:56839 length:1095 start_codon:yes stop_codon:yes gene_type:complete
MKYRPAKISDIPKLVSLENSSFDSDQLTDRNFKYFIDLSHGEILVQELEGEISGYGVILFHRGTALSRLYSLAVDQKLRGKGLGKKLLLKLEKMAKDRGSTYLRLEVKSSNRSAIQLYESCGYRKFALKKDYYEDHEDAQCYEKKIRNLSGKVIKGPKVPHYQQTTEFTCGPSSLLMAMKALSKKTKFNREHEIEIWREATTIFMTSGHGGCGPHGLALAAHKRGFEVELYLNSSAPLFIEGVRSKHKKEIIELVQKDFENKIKKEKIKVFKDEYDWDTIREIFAHGGIPVLLISAYRLTETKAPHWIVLTAMEGDFIYFHDPEIDAGQSVVDNFNVPVRRDEFELMAKFGSRQLKSIVALYRD